MAKKYDVIVVGAGPAGLMAAKTAGENGLHVALLERKQYIPEIRRACAMLWLVFNEGYFGEWMLFNPKNSRLCFPKNGFSVKYDGPVKNIYAVHGYSSEGHQIRIGDCDKGKKIGDPAKIAMVHDKSALLAGLLKEVEHLGVEVFSNINVTGVEKRKTGVIVLAGEQEYSAPFVIAADGVNSLIAQKLGFNKNRKYYGMLLSRTYTMVDVEVADPYAVSFSYHGQPLPFIIALCPLAGREGFQVIGITMNPRIEPDLVFNRFMREGFFQPWFKKAKKIKELAAVENLWEPIAEPYKDNVLLIGDTAWCQEAENTGSLMCGWKAGNVVTVALSEGKVGREGVEDYVTWWQDSFCNHYEYRDYIKTFEFPLLLNDEEINYLFSQIKETMRATLNAYAVFGIIGGELGKVMGKVAQERPDLIPKIQTFASASAEELLSEAIKEGFPNR